MLFRSPRVRENWDVLKTRQFGHFWPFSWAIEHSFWVRTRFQRLMTPGTRKLGRPQNSSIWSFLPFSWAIAHNFFGSGTISTARDPGYKKFGRRQNSSIWSFLAVFVGYSTQFSAPETISTARDPWYTKIGMSSKLVDLVIYGRFRGL